MRALAYRFGQGVLAPGARRTSTAILRRWSERYPVGTLVLDVGCGPRSWLVDIGVRPVGVDRSRPMVRSFHAGFGIGVAGDAAALPFADSSFDSVWCFGLLHHLPDASARAAVREARRVARPGGPVVVVDAVPSTVRRRVIARVIRQIDRGRWIRPADRLRALLHGLGEWEFEPIRYSVFGLEGVVATCTRG